MLDRLPPELIDRILLLVVGPEPPAVNKASRERQKTLMACSLVCSDEFGAMSFKTAIVDKEALKEHVRVLRADGKVDFPLASVLPALASLPRLTTLSLVRLNKDEDQLDFCSLAAIPQLRDLVLQGATINRFQTSLLFPHLTSLTLNFLKIHPSTLSFLTCNALPSLEALSLSQLRDASRPPNFDFFLPSLPRALLNQLDILLLHSTGHALIVSEMITPSTVFNLGPELGQRQLDLPPFSPILACPYFAIPPIPSALFSSGNSTARETSAMDVTFEFFLLSDLFKLIEAQGGSFPRAVFVPSDLQTFLATNKSNELALQLLSNAIPRMINACRLRDIEVVWYEEEDSPATAFTVQPAIQRILCSEKQRQLAGSTDS